MPSIPQHIVPRRRRVPHAKCRLSSNEAVRNRASAAHGLVDGVERMQASHRKHPQGRAPRQPAVSWLASGPTAILEFQPSHSEIIRYYNVRHTRHPREYYGPKTAFEPADQPSQRQNRHNKPRSGGQPTRQESLMRLP